MTSKYATGKKTYGLAATAALCATIIPILSPSTTPSAQAQDSQCSAVHIVTAQGTGQSSTDKGNDDLGGFAEGKLAQEMKNKFPGQVSTWQTNYPSSAGALYSAGAMNGETTTYGDSRLNGAKAMVKHITEYRTQCPGAKIMLTGYSQGASVAGDAAALIANGASSNTKSEDVMGVVLYADPGRSGNSQYTGTQGSTAYIPLPKGAKYQRNGEYVSEGHEQDTVGWTGQRSLPFTGMEGRVISLCSPKDLACSVTDKSLLRDVADASDKNWKPSPESYRNRATIISMITKGKLNGVLGGLLGGGSIGKLKSGDIPGFLNMYHGLVSNDKNLSSDEKDTLFNAETELRYLFKLLKSDKGYGENVPNSAIVSHILQQVGQELPNNSAVPEQYRTPLKLAIRVLTSGDTSSIPADVKSRMETTVKYATAFPDNHGAYFNDKSNYKVEGQSAEQWATGAVEQGIRNVIENKPYQVNAGSNPREKNAELEVSDPERLDDGLRGVVDPNFNSSNFDPGKGLVENIGSSDSSSKPSDPTNNDNIPTPSVEDVSDSQSGNNGSQTSGNNGSQTEDDTSNGVDKDNDTSRGKSKDSSKTVEKSSVEPSESASISSTPSAQPASGAAELGPKVNTGGRVESTFFNKVLSIIR